MKTVNSVVTLDVAFTYDSIGRMLTRKLSTDANSSRFEWDGWDLVREVDPAGVETVYCAPLGEILSLRRTSPGLESETYQVHVDALGSVRAMTDPTGTGIDAFAYDAWGEAVVEDESFSATMCLRFIGGHGVSLDKNSTHYFMRTRWYDSSLSTFLSRDILRNRNRYQYASGNPTSRVDPLGLEGVFVGAGPDIHVDTGEVEKQLPGARVDADLTWEEIKKALVETPGGIVVLWAHNDPTKGGVSLWVDDTKEARTRVSAADILDYLSRVRPSRRPKTIVFAMCSAGRDFPSECPAGETQLAGFSDTINMVPVGKFWPLFVEQLSGGATMSEAYDAAIAKMKARGDAAFVPPLMELFETCPKSDGLR